MFDPFVKRTFLHFKGKVMRVIEMSSNVQAGNQITLMPFKSLDGNGIMSNGLNSVWKFQQNLAYPIIQYMLIKIHQIQIGAYVIHTNKIFGHQMSYKSMSRNSNIVCLYFDLH